MNKEDKIIMDKYAIGEFKAVKSSVRTMYSNCCGSIPIGELDRQNLGKCSKCGEGAVFNRISNKEK